jgi:lysophospholipase L1-like esterase
MSMIRALRSARLLLSAMTLVATALLFVAATPAHANNKVILFGDSWGALMGSPLASQFDANGHSDYDVLNLSIPGSTADQYATNFGGVMDVTLAYIIATPEVQYVVISLGGNDLHALYASQGLNANAIIEQDLRVVIDRINAARPGLQILITGYDLLKWDKSPECLLLASTVFVGQLLPQQINPIYLDYASHLNAVSASYANVTYVNEPFGLWGTGQGNPGAPNIFAWSPSSYVASDSADCVHLSTSGFNLFTAQIYAKYFKPRLGAGTCGAIHTSGSEASKLASEALPILAPIAVAATLRRRARRPAPRD